MMQLQALNARLPDPGHVRKNRCLEEKNDKHASLSQLFSIFPCFPCFSFSFSNRLAKKSGGTGRCKV